MNYNHITVWIEIDAECVSGEINKLVLKFGFEKHLRWLLTCKKYIIKSLKVAAAVKTSSEGFIEERINSELATLKSGKCSRARPFRTLKTNIHIMRCVLFSAGKQRSLNDLQVWLRIFLPFIGIYMYIAAATCRQKCTRSPYMCKVLSVFFPHDYASTCLAAAAWTTPCHWSLQQMLETVLIIQEHRGKPAWWKIYLGFFFSPLLSCRSGLVHTSTFFPCLVHLKYGLIHQK